MNIWVLMYEHFEDTWVEGVFTEEGKQKKNTELFKFAQEDYQKEIDKINHNLEILRKDRATCSRSIQEISKDIKETEDIEVKKMGELDKKHFLSLEKKFSTEIFRLERELAKYSDERILDTYLDKNNLVWRVHQLNN